MRNKRAGKGHQKLKTTYVVVRVGDVGRVVVRRVANGNPRHHTLVAADVVAHDAPVRVVINVLFLGSRGSVRRHLGGRRSTPVGLRGGGGGGGGGCDHRRRELVRHLFSLLVVLRRSEIALPLLLRSVEVGSSRRELGQSLGRRRSGGVARRETRDVYVLGEHY